MRFLTSILLIFVCESLCGIGLEFKFKPKAPRAPVQRGPRIVDPFLVGNAKRPEVEVKPSGLQIEMFDEGYGRLPQQTDLVVINYNGFLPDGTLFDSSYKRGEPATFPVDSVVPGFGEALMNIRLGGKAKVFIPSHLAYGQKGSGKAVPPNSTIIFELEVLDIKE
jgi:FKBP-type peptidyl-prolyl cis-trans isomerase FklB